MKRRIAKTIALAAVLLGAVCSCSIKESRLVCPSRVTVHVTKQGGAVTDGTKGNLYFYSWKDGRLTRREELSGMSDGGADIEFTSERGILKCLVTNKELDGDRYTVPYGDQFTDLYSSVCTIDCTGDEASYTFGPLNKQFCDIILHLAKAPSAVTTKADVPDWDDFFSGNVGIVFRSPWNGIMAVPDPANPDKPYVIEAAEGEFCYSTAFDTTGTAGVRVSRQGGPGLEAVITFPDGRDFILDLYQYMEEACYDWFAESLADFEGTLLIEPVSGRCELIDWRTIEVDVIRL